MFLLLSYLGEGWLCGGHGLPNWDVVKVRTFGFYVARIHSFFLCGWSVFGNFPQVGVFDLSTPTLDHAFHVVFNPTFGLDLWSWSTIPL